MTQMKSASGNHSAKHEHRTAKVVELVSTSTKSFEDAIRNCLKDATASTRGITGAHVLNMSVKCTEGKITEYKVNLNVAFGIERT
jgi:flavin-binding protein dodecin